jgi:hypothetical protein
MLKDNIDSLIKHLKDPEMSTLADIAKLSYPAFLRRVGKKMRLAWSHHLYQYAIHSSDEGKERAKLLRKNPQFKNIASLQNHKISEKESENSVLSTKHNLSGEK